MSVVKYLIFVFGLVVCVVAAFGQVPRSLVPVDPVPLRGDVMETDVREAVSFDLYIQAFAHFARQRAMHYRHGGGGNVSPWIFLANADPTLIKFPGVRMQTMAILQDLRNAEELEKRTAKEISATREKQSRAMSSGTPNFRRPPRPPSSPMAEESKVRVGAQQQMDVILTSMEKRIAALIETKTTRVGESFAMPRDAKFYVSLSSSSLTDPNKINSDQPTGVTGLRIEVAGKTEDGILGYAMKVVKDENGQPVRDTDGDFQSAADRSRTVCVVGYPQTASMGEIIFMQVRRSGERMINGQRCTEYTFFEKR